MNRTRLYVDPIYEPDESKREKMMFFNPFNANVIEGASAPSAEKDQDLSTTVILSSN